MKRTCTLALLALLAAPSLAPAESHAGSTAEEVAKMIRDSYAKTRETGESPSGEIAAAGSLEFWSSGGLLNEARPGAKPRKWQSFNLHAKHIRVVPLREGEIALALYYLEGSMQPAGFPSVPHYLTRVSEIYVKEGTGWKRRHAHWSAITGGSGTSQSAE